MKAAPFWSYARRNGSVVLKQLLKAQRKTNPLLFLYGKYNNIWDIIRNHINIVRPHPQMSPMCKNSVRWLYRLDQNYSWDSGIPIAQDHAYRDARGKVRLIIEAGGRITVTRGYSWNGCSPKICVLDLLIGTPDGVVHARTGRPKTYFASFVHDALYQFLRVDAPMSRRQADACFLRLMAASDFSLRYLYWAAVRVAGWLVWHGKRYVRKWSGEAVDLRALRGKGPPGSTPLNAT